MSVLQHITNEAMILMPHNRCGHDPANLRSYQKPMFHVERPPLLKKAATALELGAQYVSRTKRRLLNTFNCLNPSARQKRSERREALLLVLGRILHYTDIASLNVGVPKKNSFYFTSVEEIAKDTGLHHQRVLRALHDAENALYIKLSYQKSPTTGHIFYQIVVKYLLFLDLGISRYFIERARTYAQKQVDKKPSAIILPRVRLGTNIKKIAKPSYVFADKTNIEKEKERLEDFIRLRAEHPERTIAELYPQVYGRPFMTNTS